ncbi:unnamed protein product [Chrysoparadoxa australica]
MSCSRQFVGSDGECSIMVREVYGAVVDEVRRVTTKAAQLALHAGTKRGTYFTGWLAGVIGYPHAIVHVVLGQVQQREFLSPHVCVLDPLVSPQVSYILEGSWCEQVSLHARLPYSLRCPQGCWHTLPTFARDMVSSVPSRR